MSTIPCQRTYKTSCIWGTSPPPSIRFGAFRHAAGKDVVLGGGDDRIGGRREEFGQLEAAGGERLDAGDDAQGVEMRAQERGVRAVVCAKERAAGEVLTKRLHALGDDVVQIDEVGALLLGRLPRPQRVAVVLSAHDLALAPGVARNERTDDRRGATFAGFLDVPADMPAERMHLIRLAVAAGDAGRLIAVALRRPGVIVSELDEDIIARLDVGLDRAPPALLQEAAAAGAAERLVLDIDPRRFEVEVDGVAPAPASALATVFAAVLDGRITDHPKGGQATDEPAMALAGLCAGDIDAVAGGKARGRPAAESGGRTLPCVAPGALHGLCLRSAFLR